MNALLVLSAIAAAAGGLVGFCIGYGVATERAARSLTRRDRAPP